MGEKNLIDISAFLLFEASGDSEAADAKMVCTNMAEDDAISRSYDSSSNYINGCINNDEHIDDGFNHFPKLIDDGHAQGVRDNCYVKSPIDDEDEDEGVVDQVLIGVGGDHNKQQRKMSGVNMKRRQRSNVCIDSSTMKLGQRKKSKVCVDSTIKLVNQREQDTLFWETCLAS